MAFRWGAWAPRKVRSIWMHACFAAIVCSIWVLHCSGGVRSKWGGGGGGYWRNIFGVAAIISTMYAQCPQGCHASMQRPSTQGGAPLAWHIQQQNWDGQRHAASARPRAQHDHLVGSETGITRSAPYLRPCFSCQMRKSQRPKWHPEPGGPCGAILDTDARHSRLEVPRGGGGGGHNDALMQME